MLCTMSVHVVNTILLDLEMFSRIESVADDLNFQNKLLNRVSSIWNMKDPHKLIALCKV